MIMLLLRLHQECLRRDYENDIVSPSGAVENIKCNHRVVTNLRAVVELWLHVLNYTLSAVEKLPFMCLLISALRGDRHVRHDRKTITSNLI